MEIFTKNSAKCTVFQSTICNKFSSLMIADRQKMLFSDVKTSAADPKQQRTPDKHLETRDENRCWKCGNDQRVSRLRWYPMRSLFNARPALNMVILRLGGPRRLTQISTRATMIRRRHEIVARLKMVLAWDYMTVRTLHLTSLRSVVALWMTVGILLRRRLPRSRQTDRAPAPMPVLHHSTPVVNHRMLCL
jgi:hypothetical protein